MAQYICPGCGQRFNGKKCRNCYYETFDDDIARNLHTHQEVNKTDLPISRPAKVRIEWEQQKRDFKRQQEKRRQPRKSPKWLTWLLVFLLLEPAMVIVGELVDSISFGTWEPEAPMPEAVITDDYRQIYTGQGFTLYIADPEGDVYPLILENATDQDVHFSINRLVVDGFQTERSHAYCSANAGTTMAGALTLDPEDMAYATMSTPGQIEAFFQIYDADSYEDILNASFTIHQGPGDILPAPAGDVLLDREDIQLRYLGYTADEWNPENFWEGRMLFYLENNTEETLSIYAQEVLFGGEAADLGLWVELPGNTRTVTRMWLYALEDWEELDPGATLQLHLVTHGDGGELLDLGWVTVDSL